MTFDEAIEFLKSLRCTIPKDQNRKSAGWAVSDCPLGTWNHDHGKSKADAFGVRIEDGDPFTHCWSCGWSGSATDLIIELRAKSAVFAPFHKPDIKRAMQLIAQAEENAGVPVFGEDTIEDMLFGAPVNPLHVFPEWWLSSFPTIFDAKEARDYLIERHVGPEIAEELDLRWDSYQKRVCFPVRGKDKQLYGFHGRAIKDNVEPRYRMYRHQKINNPIVWLGEHDLDTTKPVLIVEGPFDLASAKRVYKNTASPLFANPSLEKLRRLDAIEWFTLLDRGTGGDKGRETITKRMSKSREITHLWVPEHRKDPGEMSVTELCEVLEAHLPLDV